MGAYRDDSPEVVVHLGDGSGAPRAVDPADLGADAPDPAPDHPFLLLTRTETEYIQARYLDEGTYELEHVDGADHRQLFTTDALLVRDIVWSWIQRDSWWRDTVAWTTVDPAVAELNALRAELSEMLDGISIMDSVTDELDRALARADELLGADLDFGDDPFESG
ncbi:hypothetical protein [Nocardia rhizosphaerihabitans]|uniref:Uncharacterized protein n=1 Tax=Nocardia rhizosphaerihabitans TaxID=1691570 RepID=A0ABQ2KTQ3_9NOCA|nr:hypothetical protein [Nocardia rhizosphaerihabitans]GGN92933.1 hypothetical protein GCM10011610_54390 [Nocardia rhizosphaerihabitans]